MNRISKIKYVNILIIVWIVSGIVIFFAYIYDNNKSIQYIPPQNSDTIYSDYKNDSTFINLFYSLENESGQKLVYNDSSYRVKLNYTIYKNGVIIEDSLIKEKIKKQIKKQGENYKQVAEDVLYLCDEDKSFNWVPIIIIIIINFLSAIILFFLKERKIPTTTNVLSNISDEISESIKKITTGNIIIEINDNIIEFLDNGNCKKPEYITKKDEFVELRTKILTYNKLENDKNDFDKFFRILKTNFLKENQSKYVFSISFIKDYLNAIKDKEPEKIIEEFIKYMASLDNETKNNTPNNNVKAKFNNYLNELEKYKLFINNLNINKDIDTKDFNKKINDINNKIKKAEYLDIIKTNEDNIKTYFNNKISDIEKGNKFDFFDESQFKDNDEFKKILKEKILFIFYILTFKKMKGIQPEKWSLFYEIHLGFNENFDVNNIKKALKKIKDTLKSLFND